MGRAIDMEKDIDSLKAQVKKLEDIVRGMTHSMDEMSEKATKTTHVDLVEDVKTEEIENAEEKETNDEGDGKSNKRSDKPARVSKGKSK